jgi:ribosomal protein L24E
LKYSVEGEGSGDWSEGKDYRGVPLDQVWGGERTRRTDPRNPAGPVPDHRKGGSMNLESCGRCSEPIEAGEPRGIVRDDGAVIAICVPCIFQEYANPDDVPLYTSRKDYERKMIAKYGRE